MTLSREIKRQIVTLSDHTTKTQREIARELSISELPVRKTLKIWRENGSLEEHNAETRRRNRLLSDREKRALVRESKKGPRKCAREVRVAAGNLSNPVSIRI